MLLRFVLPEVRTFLQERYNYIRHHPGLLLQKKLRRRKTQTCVFHLTWAYVHFLRFHEIPSSTSLFILDIFSFSNFAWSVSSLGNCSAFQDSSAIPWYINRWFLSELRFFAEKKSINAMISGSPPVIVFPKTWYSRENKIFWEHVIECVEH